MPIKDPVKRKLKQAEYSKRYYENNRSEVIAKNNVRRKDVTAKFAEFKATLSCKKCGENHPATLDFHHIERHRSNKKVHYLVSNGHHWPRIMDEVAKCLVLCSNCHRKLHFDERKLAKAEKSSNI